MSAYHDVTAGDLPLFRPAPKRVEAPPFVHGSETSREAAVAIRPVAGTLRALVLETITASPCHDEEGAERAGMNPSTWRPRRVELEQAGLIRKVGERPGRSGRMMAVWAAAGISSEPALP